MPPITHTPPAPAGLKFTRSLHAPGRRLEQLLFWIVTAVTIGSATWSVLA